ncbi:MAG: TetR/AcrR family transcriptional regulator [Bacteroidales bacterium]|nr:TetR/AcrR family transcriptional regulator [Bacteroidales bacterium]
MTEKQEKILQAALELFAQEGFHATSTSKVAKHACVSEGLIFRHFGNKEGLLQAILDEGERRFRVLFADIVMETNPGRVIRKTIEMTSQIDASDYDFWKLQYKLKWELEVSGDEKMEPLKLALSNAFSKLDFESPGLEVALLLLFIDGLGSAVLKGSSIDVNEITQFLLKKYNL